MGRKKRRQLILFNAAIVLVNIALFSNALLGLSLFAGTALSVSLAWTAVLGSGVAFFAGNARILREPEARLPLRSIQTLESCIPALERAMQNGDAFDEILLKNIEQIKRFRRKCDTIKDALLQKFSAAEMSFQKFSGVLSDIEGVVLMNMRGILNKISAFDIDEYEAMQKRGIPANEFSQEKMEIYSEYIGFVERATRANEEILLKLDKMLLEISRYNSLEDGDVQRLPAMIEMDELIKNANLYN